MAPTKRKQTRSNSVLTELVRLKTKGVKKFKTGAIAKTCNLKSGHAAGMAIRLYANQLNIERLDDKGNYQFAEEACTK